MVDKDWLAEGLGDTRKPEDAENAADVPNAENAGNAEDPEGQYRKLPEPVRVEDMIATKDTRPVPDPKMGRDTETDFMLRNAGGFG